MTQQFKEMKIRIKDEEHSRLVQKALFEMGYVWSASLQKTVQETSRKFLICECTGRIYHCGYDVPYFERLEFEEVELVTTYSFKPVYQEVLRKRKEKEDLERNVADMQKQLDEMKQRLEKM